MAAENLLLAQLPADVRQRLGPLLTSVRLHPGQTVLHPGEPARDVYFPTTGWIALELAALDGQTVELATVGREGLLGLSVLLPDGATPYRAVVVADGLALRLAAVELRAAFHQHPPIREAVLRYDHHLFREIAQMGLCHRVHTALQRLSRWLLASADRAHSDTVVVTQDRLARAIGAGESAVSHVVAELNTAEAIWSRRGALVIRNRQRLERTACECYRVLSNRAQTPAETALPR